MKKAVIVILILMLIVMIGIVVFRKIKIKKDEILKNDSLDISQKRKNFKSTFYHDLEMVDKILNKKNYHIVAIGFYNNNDSFLSISVVTDDIYKKLKNFEKQLES